MFYEQLATRLFQQFLDVQLHSESLRISMNHKKLKRLAHN